MPSHYVARFICFQISSRIITTYEMQMDSRLALLPSSPRPPSTPLCPDSSAYTCICASRIAWLLGTRGSPGAAPGRGRRASMVVISFPAPYYSPYGFHLSVSPGPGILETLIRGRLYPLMVRFDLRFPASSPAPPPHSPRSEYRSDSLAPCCRSRRVPMSKFHRSDMRWSAPDRRRIVSPALHHALPLIYASRNSAPEEGS